MSFPRYPRYKDSGVEWLGDVPEHWEVFPLKRELAFITSGSRGWAVNYADDGELFLRIGNLTRDQLGLDLSEIQRVVVPNGEEAIRTKVSTGDVLFSVTAYLGSVALIPEEFESAYVSQHIALTRLAGQKLIPRWVGYTALSVSGKTWFDLQAYGGTKIQLSLDDIRNFPIPVPTFDEQTAIAAFLDRETAKINALVAEQRQLIELLKEKRQAVISHAVTKGLNPDAPMKPSGIEWLGDVPVHWDVERLKHSITKIEQGWSPQCDSEPALEGEWGVLKVGCVNRDQFDPTEQKALPRDAQPLPEYEINDGDILMSRGNTRELVGMATLAKQPRPRLLLCDLLYRFHVRPERVMSEFLVFSLRSANVRFQIEREASGTSASMKKIGQGTIRDFVICVPPLHEQQAIIGFITAETEKLDTLTAEAQRAIDLLQERRTALISAAVTGKIDVRGLAAEEEAA